MMGRLPALVFLGTALSCGSRTGLPDYEAQPSGDASGDLDSGRAETGPDAAPIVPAPWPMFGHDAQHTSRGGARGPQGANVKWTLADAGTIGDTVVGADGTIYFASGQTLGDLMALNPDGTKRWSVPLVPYPDGLMTPAIAPDGTLYVRADRSTTLFAVGPDGSIRWSVDTTLPGNDQAPITVDRDGTIYVDNLTHLDAYHPDGTRKWDFVSDDGEFFATPSLGADGTVYATCDDIGLCALTSSGAKKWRFDATFQVFSGSSIGRDGTSYFGSYDQNVYAVNADGSRQWAFATRGTIGFGNAAAPAIASDGTLYVMADNDQGGSLLCALTPSGSQKWQFALDGKLFSPGLLDAEDTFYFVESLSNAGTLHALRADGTPLFSMPVGQASAAPSLGADGTLYVGTSDGTLQAIGP